MVEDKKILDACCGGRMFWFDKKHPDAIFVDNRDRKSGHCEHRPNHSVKPDIIADFRNLPFEDKSFKLVVFDPPHIFGKETSNLTKQYGWLDKDSWSDYILEGFNECWRVLDDNGVLIFKWNEARVKKSEIINLIPQKPLFGNQVRSRAKTHWLCFMKND